MVKWTEVSAYSGMPVDEDAPTNATGAAVSTDVPIVRKKRKMSFLDARTREYKSHQKRLEASRARREERKKNASKINEGQLDEREKGIDSLPRQFLNPDKEVMILKKGKVIVIDKKDKDRYMRQGWELAEEQISEMKKVEIKLHPRNIDKTIQKIVKHIGIENRGRGTKIQVIQNMSDDSVTLDGRGADVGRQVADIRNFIGFKSAKVIEGVEPKTFTQKVQEQIGGFEREIYLAENNIDVIKSVVKSKGAKNLKMKDGKMMVDLFSASAIMNVYNKVNPNNKKKMEKLANGTRADLGKLQRLAMKFA